MKHILMMAITFTAFIFFSLSAEANEINSLEMDIEINEDGSVSVTETREAYMDEGTENYIVFNEEDMDGIEVTDFSVEGFTEEENWNLDAGREMKTGKYGTVDTDDGTELVWGIGEYGEHTYVVKYTLENAVRNLEGGQSLYYNFDSFTGLPTENFKMNVTSDISLNDENIKFWGFGFEGDIVTVGDDIQWTAGETLTDDNGAALLMHFPEGTFNTDVSGEGSVEEEQEEAMDGSIYDDGSLGTGWIVFIVSIIGVLGALAAAVVVFIVKLSSKYKDRGHIASAGTIKRRNKDQETNVPPAIDDYAGIAFMLMHMNMGYFEDIFQACLMKWTDEGRIKIEIDQQPDKKLDKGSPKIFIHDYQSLIDGYSYSFEEISEHLEDNELESGYEALLWRMLLDIADDEGVIDEKRLKKWSKKHAKEVGAVADELREYSNRWLETNGYANYKKDKLWGMPVPITAPTEKGNQLVDHLSRYKNYLEEDYSRIYENDENYRQHIIWSVLVGEGENVRKYLSKLTPDETGDSIYPTMVNYYYGPHLTSQTWSKGLSEGGFSSHNSPSTSAASGGGGVTGVGGGGGAAGGGGGGAR